MGEEGTVRPAPTARRGADPVVVTGAAVLTVARFDVSGRRVRTAAAMPGSPELFTELTRAVREACDDAGLSPSDRARTPLFLAIHGDPAIARAAEADKPGLGPEALTAAAAGSYGLAQQGLRCYMSACVAASTAVADAAAIIARGHAR